MRLAILLLIAALAGVIGCNANVLPSYTELPASEAPATDTGTIHRYRVHSQQLDDDLIIDVWTPQSYNPSGDIRYPVIYAHDGQNLFDPAMSFTGVVWELDKCIGDLIQNDEIVAPIVVGITNRSALRPADYFPQKAIDYIADSDRPLTRIFNTCSNGFYGDRHASFVATELKPLIDHLYHTDSRPSHTFALGSSMGALASLYLMCEYPTVFGGAVAMSTHWIGSLDANPDYTLFDDTVCANAILDYMAANLPSPDSHILYLDRGTTGLDAQYGEYEELARRIASDKGYSVADHTLYLHDAEGAGHNEWSWQQRVHLPLRFILSKNRPELSGIDTMTASTMLSDHTTAIYTALGQYTHSTIDPLSATITPGLYIVTTPGNISRKLLIK